jgi:hypothetical protein
VPPYLLDWTSSASIPAVGTILLVSIACAAAAGTWLRARLAARRGKDEGSNESYIVSAVLGLLALLLGFTFSLAIERFEIRRELVVQDANAIGTAYLRVQLLDEPHKTRLSDLLVAYTDNRIALAKVPAGQGGAMLAWDDKLLTDIWSATAAAFDSVRTTAFANALLESMNAMIDLDSARRAARQAHVPSEVFVLLLIYVIGTAGVLGYVLGKGRSRFAAAFLLLLLSLSFLLIIDIDRATSGSIVESQGPMEALSQSLHAQPPGTFDRWRDSAQR